MMAVCPSFVCRAVAVATIALLSSCGGGYSADAVRDSVSGNAYEWSQDAGSHSGVMIYRIQFDNIVGHCILRGRKAGEWNWILSGEGVVTVSAVSPEFVDGNVVVLGCEALPGLVILADSPNRLRIVYAPGKWWVAKRITRYQ